jgi:hypothetical protein
MPPITPLGAVELVPTAAIFGTAAGTTVANVPDVVSRGNDAAEMRPGATFDDCGHRIVHAMVVTAPHLLLRPNQRQASTEALREVVNIVVNAIIAHRI